MIFSMSFSSFFEGLLLPMAFAALRFGFVVAGVNVGEVLPVGVVTRPRASARRARVGYKTSYILRSFINSLRPGHLQPRALATF